MEYVSFDEFAKLDLRVGKIIEVNDHPNADRLYVVKVDLGDEVRQLVAGLKKYYKPEELLGHYVVIIANLEPKKLRGVESQDAAGSGRRRARCPAHAGQRGKARGKDKVKSEGQLDPVFSSFLYTLTSPCFSSRWNILQAVVFGIQARS